MMQHLNEMKGIMNQLTSMELKIPEEIRAYLFLNTLPDSWEPLRNCLSYSAPDRKLNMTDETNSLLNE